ncbi:hypothetical protein TNCV_1045821 [Trichonephila clavipes]|nr:hypothetical protein TNCV_1045821 [Trichonephila clavipes]
MGRISICSSKLASYKTEPFLDHVTGDEKWTTYKHVVREKACVYKGKTLPSTSKAGVHQKKVMLCCCNFSLSPVWGHNGLSSHPYDVRFYIVDGLIGEPASRREAQSPIRINWMSCMSSAFT